MRCLVLWFWSKMHTEEVFLIPRQMYANERPQISQLLNKKMFWRTQNKCHCCRETGLHQQLLPHNKTRNSGQIIFWRMSKISWMRPETRKLIQKFQMKKLSEFWEILNTLTEKIEKTSIILEKIEESECISLDQTSRLMVNRSSTGILFEIFFTIYNKQLISFHLNITKSWFF